MKDKNGIITQEDCAIYVSHAYAQWKPNYVYDFGGGITSAVIDGVFVQTNYGKGTGIANFNVVNILLGKVVSVCPAFVSSSNPEEGVLYDSEGKEVSDISFKADGSSSSLSLTATFKRGGVYTYVKVTVEESDGKQVNQILKIRFDWTE
ncbi:hypothetical protein ACIXOC_10140 [Bacteroides fragilis]